MKNMNKDRIFLCMSILILFMALPLSSQLKRNGLIFSEVYLNKKDAETSWVEVFNPTADPLVLENFCLGHFLTLSILPEDIHNSGININPGECIVLCANKLKFNFNIESQTRLFQVDDIRCLGKGSYIILTTKKLGEDGVDVFRYGEPKETSELENRYGSFVVPFSENAKSYNREKNENPSELFLPVFFQDEPSCGRYSLK